MSFDLACYRAVEPVTGRVLGIVSAEANADYGLPAVEIALKTPVATVVRATVNGTDSSVVELVGKQRVLVTVPEVVAQLDPRYWVVRVYAEVDYESLSDVPSPTSIGFGARVTTVAGPMEALQRAVRALLMDPGSDVYNRNRGGGLRRLKGLLLNPSDMSPVARDVQIAVDAYNRTVAATRLRMRADSWHVTRIEMLSIRALTPAQASAEFASTRDRGVATDDSIAGSAAPTDMILAISFGHDMRGPQGARIRSSSAIAL